jgi:uncharacterized membrane protein YtjA (UPF0391 family)
MREVVNPRRATFLHGALILFLVAVIAALLGFSVLAPQAARLAKVVAMIAGILALGGWLFHLRMKRRQAERVALGEHPMRDAGPHT